MDGDWAMKLKEDPCSLKGEHLYDYYLGISVREVTYLHFSMILSHSFIWTIFLSCLILLNFLCLFLDIKEVMS